MKAASLERLCFPEPPTPTSSAWPPSFSTIPAWERRRRGGSHAAASTPSSPPVQVQVHFLLRVSTRDARDVLHRVLEKDQVHDRVALVVLLERVFQHGEHLVDALDLVVRVLLDVLRGNEITKPPRLARATWRRSRGRLDGATVAWRRADAIDAKFKLRN